MTLDCLLSVKYINIVLAGATGSDPVAENIQKMLAKNVGYISASKFILGLLEKIRGKSNNIDV